MSNLLPSSLTQTHLCTLVRRNLQVWSVKKLYKVKLPGISSLAMSDTNRDVWTSLHEAAADGNLASAKELLANGAAVNAMC